MASNPCITYTTVASGKDILGRPWRVAACGHGIALDGDGRDQFIKAWARAELDIERDETVTPDGQ